MEGERIAVCICTCRRPQVLDQLLQRLGPVVDEVAARARVELVVVDDDPAASARAVVAERASAFADATYVVTGAGNISVARNRALEEGMARAELLALIDDDCLPRDGWLTELLSVHDRFGADIVSGHSIDLAPPGAPRWYQDEPWVRPGAPVPDGTVVVDGGVKNTLLRSDALRRIDVRFDEGYGVAGGEDGHFFARAVDAGLVARAAAGAVVEETVPLARTSLRYQLRRALWSGNADAAKQVDVGRRSRFRLILGALAHLGDGPRHLVAQARRGGPSEWRWATALSLMAIGRVLGVLGVRVRHASLNASVRPR